jgi:hypothetical protein
MEPLNLLIGRSLVAEEVRRQTAPAQSEKPKRWSPRAAIRRRTVQERANVGVRGRRPTWPAAPRDEQPGGRLLVTNNRGQPS